MKLIEIEGLRHTYHDGTQALRGVDFVAHQGEFVFLLGKNGSGKTTLLQHLNGLLSPQEGRVLIRGTDIEKLPDEEVYRTVGLVLQDPNDQLFAPTVLDDVSFGPYNLGLSPEEVRRRATEALEEVEMLAYTDKGVHHLSYGQKKKVALAGILAMNPAVLVLDEPTAGLDPAGEEEIMRLISHLNEEHQLTVIMATHDVDLAAQYADSIWVLERGKMVLHGSPQEVLRDPERLKALGLRLPRVTEMFYRLRRDGLFNGAVLPGTIEEGRQALMELLWKNVSKAQPITDDS